MSLIALFNLGGGEIILVLAIVLLLFGGTRLPGIGEGLWQGINEFRKATRQVAEDMTEQKADDFFPSHPILMTLTLVLGTVCVILLLYELSK